MEHDEEHCGPDERYPGELFPCLTRQKATEAWKVMIEANWVSAKERKDIPLLETIIVDLEEKGLTVEAAECEHELASLKEYWYELDNERE